MSRTRSHWHWGFVEEFPDEAARDALAERAAYMIPNLGARVADALPTVENVKLQNARISVPAALAHCATTDVRARVMHASGKGYRDILRAFRGEFPFAPDVVVHAERDEDIAGAFELSENRVRCSFRSAAGRASSPA